MKRTDLGLSLLTAGLVALALKQFRVPLNHYASYPELDFDDAFLDGLPLDGTTYAVDADAPIYLGDVVAVRCQDGSTSLTSYCDELLLLGRVVGRVTRV